MISRTVLGPTRVPRSSWGRRLAFLATASLAFYALLGGTGFAGATGGPGSPDFLPNDGHGSNPMGVSYGINQDGVMYCSGDAVSGLGGTYDLTVSGTAPSGAYLVLYLTPNNGSNADPIGNVEDNHVHIDISGMSSGTYPWSLTITSPFTVSKGGILALFATPGAADDWTGGRSNSLNCTEAQPTPTPTPTEVVPTPTPTEVVPTPTPTEVVPTPTPTEVVPTPTPTEVVPTPTPTPTATATATATTTTPPTNPPTTPPTTPPTPTPTLPVTNTATPTGEELPAAGTPPPTLPSTSTADGSTGNTGGSLALILALLALGSIGIVVLSPLPRRTRR